MPTYRYDQRGVANDLQLGVGGGRLVWNTDHFEVTSDGSTLTQLRVPTTPVDPNDSASKAYVDSLSGGGTSPSIAVFYPTQPPASSALLVFVADSAFSFADDFAGSVGAVETNPTASYVMTVDRNGANIGNIIVSTAGVFTFSTTGATTEALSIGDTIVVRAPGTVDATISDISFTLRGV